MTDLKLPEEATVIERSAVYGLGIEQFIARADYIRLRAFALQAATEVERLTSEDRARSGKG